MHVHAPWHDDDERDGQGPDRKGSARRLGITLGLVAAYMVAEIIGGLLSGSLALLADAGHMFSDAAALSLALFALWIAQRPATPQRTYGYYRVEVLAALANGAALLVLAAFVIQEAWKRFQSPSQVEGHLMLGVAAGGLVVNLVALWILRGGQHESVNVRGAWLHVLSDTLGSLGAVIGGALVWQLGWMWVDPAVSVLIAVLVILSAWALLREVIGVLMEGTPAHIDLERVEQELAAAPGVLEVHDLHVWTITTGIEALSGHVVVDSDQPNGELLRELRNRMRERFGIDHVTIQIEPPGFRETAPAEG